MPSAAQDRAAHIGFGCNEMKIYFAGGNEYPSEVERHRVDILWDQRLLSYYYFIAPGFKSRAFWELLKIKEEECAKSISDKAVSI